MNKTSIPWCDYTWGPVTGCTPCSPGCGACYARAMAKRFGRSFEVTLHPERLEEPLRVKKPSKIFPCSVSDLFHADVPDEFIGHVWDVMLRASWHTFLVLTKRIERGNDFLSRRYPSPLPNVWVGVSAEDQKRADERIPVLLETPAAVRFVSLEPLLDRVDLSTYMPGLSLVIAGGESGGPPERALVERCDRCLGRGHQGPDGASVTCHTCDGTTWMLKRSALEWVRSLRDQCRQAGVPFFWKGGAGPYQGAAGTLLDGVQHHEWPEVTP